MEMNPCLLAKDIGPCRMALPQYFFNNKTAQCEIFLYGGKQGNNGGINIFSKGRGGSAPVFTDETLI